MPPRPRDRKQQLLRNAAEQFIASGYHHVSVADVANSVGITAGAMYRHFANKEELLNSVIHAGLDALDEYVSDATTFDGLVKGFAEVARSRPSLSRLWIREGRHLSQQHRDLIGERIRRVGGEIGDLIANTRTSLSDVDASLLSRAVVAAHSACSTPNELSRADYESRLHAILVCLSACELPAPTPAIAAPPPPDASTISLPRKEILLVEAVRLFDERGYQSVSMTDIGVAAGITGSTIYKHYENKLEILLTALNRGQVQLQTQLVETLASASSPREALTKVIDAHVAFVLANPHLIGILVSERRELPHRPGSRIRASERDYLQAWIDLVRQINPHWSAPSARLAVRVMASIANSVARTQKMPTPPSDHARLTALLHAVLGADLDPAGE